MEPEKVFNRYDIRGKYPEELDEKFFRKMGEALGVFVSENYSKKVVVGRDNKQSSPGLKKALMDGLRSQGVNVLDVGTGPTDYTAFAGNRENAVSVQVTSSHMPLDFNGMKFMYPKGNGFLNEDLDRLKALFRQEHGRREGDIEQRDYQEEYLDKVVKTVKKHGTEFNRKVIVDTSGGSTEEILPEALERLGFEVVRAVEKEGIYRDPPKPDPERLGKLREKVRNEEAYLGVATDLDGDRIKVFFNGEWISGDDFFCVFRQVIPGKVVASVDTSQKIEDFGDVEYTRVGDPFVIDRMIKTGAVLSGEPNGHYCFPELVNYNSGVMSAAIAASINLEKKLSEVPETHTQKKNIRYNTRKEMKKAINWFKEEDLDIISKVDGVKFDTGEAVILVRPSSTSPIIRIKSEANSQKKASKGIEETLEKIGKA